MLLELSMLLELLLHLLPYCLLETHNVFVACVQHYIDTAGMGLDAVCCVTCLSITLSALIVLQARGQGHLSQSHDPKLAAWQVVQQCLSRQGPW